MAGASSEVGEDEKRFEPLWGWLGVDRWRVVNALTLARLPFVGLGTWAAFEQARLATVTFGVAAVATDMGDGMLARRWEVESEWGSNFDSLMDVLFYGGLVLWVYWFTPEAIVQHLGLIGTFFVAYLVMLVAGHLLEHSIAQHDAVSRAAGTAGGLTSLWFIVAGYEPWLLFATALFATADLAHRLHGAVQAIARRRHGV